MSDKCDEWDFTHATSSLIFSPPDYECPKCGWKSQWTYCIVHTDDEPLRPCLQCLVKLLRKHGVGEMLEVKKDDGK